MRRTLSSLAVIAVVTVLTNAAPPFARDDRVKPASACVVPPRVVGPDGIAGTADDGTLAEDFDTERDGTPGISLANVPSGTPGVLNDTIGVWVGTAAGGTGTLEGIGCAGFLVPPQDAECRIDPDDDMDWHVHCPPGACPSEPGHVTPRDGALAASGQNSLHWGYHFDPNSRDGDSVRLRQLAAFMTDPIHLTSAPQPGDLELSFLHIASMMDNHYYGLPSGQANDFGALQVQVFDPQAPGGGQWGFWDRLVPFQNVYDHIPYIWSTFGLDPTYCVLTPRDTGLDGYAPRGVTETLCFPNGVWSSCGNRWDAYGTLDCAGPGLPPSVGTGLWVQSRVSLADYLGQTVRIRWIAQSYEFDCCTDSYYELGGGWAPQIGDEGWWVDDIRVTGALQSPSQIPGAVELCNGIDDDCDGRVDEELSCPDPDLDGVQGAADNCPLFANPEQADFDQDGAGDVCDVDDGLIRIFVPAPGTVTWQQETGFETFNFYRGSLAVLRESGVYTQDPQFIGLADRACKLGGTSIADTSILAPGEAAFYLVTGVHLGVESSLGTNSAGVPRPNTRPCP